MTDTEREDKPDRESELLAQVAELEARFTALTDGLDVGVVIHGPTTEILFMNPRAEELLGATADQLRGKTSFDPRWRAIRNDETDFPAPERPTAMAFRTRLPQRGVVAGIFRPEFNDYIWLLISAVPQLNLDGSIRQVVATFANITAQRDAEVRIREQMAEIVALSVPFIPVAHGVALMPIVGVLDAAKATRILDVALIGAVAESVRTVILDMTGVTAITTDAVSALVRIVDACRLVGADVVLTGLRAEPARILAQANAALPGVRTLSHLQTAVHRLVGKSAR